MSELEKVIADCELYARVIEGVHVVQDDWKPGDPEYIEPRETLLKAAIFLRALAAARLPDREGWQPIETAPADQQLLLSWWYDYGQCWQYEADKAECTRGKWRHGRATHWQPLPQPPHLEQGVNRSGGSGDAVALNER